MENNSEIVSYGTVGIRVGFIMKPNDSLRWLFLFSIPFISNIFEINIFLWSHGSLKELFEKPSALILTYEIKIV